MDVSAGEAVVPAFELAAARAEIAKLRVCSVRSPWRTRFSRKPWSTLPKKVDCALALAGRGQPVKVPAGHWRWRAPKFCVCEFDLRIGSRTAAASEAVLLAEIKAQIMQLLTAGYPRACAWVNRQRVTTGEARVNAKRVYREMAGSALLPKAPRRRQSSRPPREK